MALKPPPLNSNDDRLPREPFRALRGQSPLLRNRKGYLLIPDRSLLDPNSSEVNLSDQDLDAVHAELRRIRRQWYARFYLKSIALLSFLVWTFWFMPLAALHLWPFH